MTKSKRFQPIHELADGFANDLSRAVAEAERHMADMERQLAQLERYRSEYLGNSPHGPGGMEAVRLQNFRSFLGRLSEAIRLQSAQLDTARADYESKRAQWAQKRSEADSLGKVIERYKVDERRTQDKREQDEVDESFARRRSVQAHE